MNLYINASGQVRCGIHAFFGSRKLSPQEVGAFFSDGCTHFECVERNERRPHAPGWNAEASHIGSCDRMVNCQGCD